MRIAQGEDYFFIAGLTGREDTLDVIVLIEQFDDHIELMRLQSFTVLVHDVKQRGEAGAE